MPSKMYMLNLELKLSFHVLEPFISHKNCKDLHMEWGYIRNLVLSQETPGLEVIKKILCSTQLSRKFILLINVKMPTIVGILTFISMIKRTSERLKARNFFICWYFSFYEQLKFRAQLS